MLADSGILSSFVLVLASEMGDKTQLLALVLAAKFKRPWPIMAGILVATLLNHALAAWAGGWLTTLVSPSVLKILLAISFFVFAAWLLIPDKDEDLKYKSNTGPFLTTTIAFFIAEMGDKTQLATVALGARYNAPLSVTLGTTAGMLVADGLAVFLGERLTKRVSMVWLHRVAALMFFAFGMTILFVQAG